MNRSTAALAAFAAAYGPQIGVYHLDLGPYIGRPLVGPGSLNLPGWFLRSRPRYGTWEFVWGDGADAVRASRVERQRKAERRKANFR